MSRGQSSAEAAVSQRTASAHSKPVSVWHQPMRVWAVAFACVVAFMGIGLVDPILPVIADAARRHSGPRPSCSSRATCSSPASPCSSPAGSRAASAPKTTLLIGLALIVVFALAAAR